ncbi:MAG: hypothetical protein O2955_04765 [Planctomycetota bacterium]|nr:hypothetical protein [Planctomycetota bacterium]MDA1211803.1 hypothetical protein [Planctomycetota bacterium]
MTTTNIIRNLRHGTLVIQDGSSPDPIALTIHFDKGDLSWTERTQTVLVRDRGSIHRGHLRRGDEEPVELSFSAYWTQLIGRSDDVADALQLYELLNFLSGLGVVSTSADGEQETLLFEFTIHDPAGEASESIVFGKVYKDTLTLRESPDRNEIVFKGFDFEPRPTVFRTP